MKITLNKIDSVNATLTVEVVKDDYAQRIKQRLKEISREIDFPGFRKGMVPHSLLEKKYGKAVLLEEIEKLLDNQLDIYIKENNLPLLKQPLPREDEYYKPDFDTPGNYQFTFDLGFTPEINVQLSKDDIVPYHTIAITDEMIDSQVNNYQKSYADYVQIDQVEEDDMIKGKLEELNEDGDPQENGIFVESMILIPSYIKDEEEKNKFLTAKTGDTVVFNPFKANEGNEAELASLLKIKKEEVNSHTGNFAYTINEITRYKEAEINQELFDKIYEPGTVTSEEQFRNKIKELITKQLVTDSDYKFLADVQQLLDEKNKDIRFPDEFLKRYIRLSNDKQTPESIEENYPKFISSLKSQLIRNQIVKVYNINVKEEDIYHYAELTARIQLAKYGMNNVSDQWLEHYIQEMLKNKETVYSFYNRILDEELIIVLKKIVTTEPKEIPMDELKKMIEPQ
ncbi:MAG: trigger factor [Dysgonamonadaceae bacterium]|jgi:trigger factor|nr:trigger factor [Dysgonamonadaceae bacterium]